MRTLQICLLILAALVKAASLAAQDVDPPAPTPGHITGTVTDTNNDPVPGATVVLSSPAFKDSRSAIANDNGFFEFNDVDAGTYNVTVRANGFADWTSPPVIVAAGQYVILTGSKLKIAEAVTTVLVSYSPIEVATEEVKIAEKQRVLGFVPNFYVVYDHETTPLTTKLKFRLALRSSVDPVTIFGSAALAAMNQAGDTPDYSQGWNGYGERFGASLAGGVSDIMIGGAILPSVLHQDPRYFYEGTGPTKSRVFHALSAPFVCRGDNGKLQPNYSSMGGDLSTGALANAYYPPSNRGAAVLFENFALTSGERMLNTILQEFVFHKMTPRAKN